VSTLHFNGEAFPTVEVVSAAQCSHEVFCGSGLKGLHFLAESCVRTSFAADKFLLVNTGIFLHFRGMGFLAPKPIVMGGTESSKNTKSKKIL